MIEASNSDGVILLDELTVAISGNQAKITFAASLHLDEQMDAGLSYLPPLARLVDITYEGGHEHWHFEW